MIPLPAEPCPEPQPLVLLLMFNDAQFRVGLRPEHPGSVLARERGGARRRLCLRGLATLDHLVGAEATSWRA